MIVVVGNREHNEDRSTVIDSADLVIRVSKMCNIDSGKTGSRTDWVVVNPNPYYWTFSEKRRHMDIIRKVERIYLVYACVHKRKLWTGVRPFFGLPWRCIPREVASTHHSMTTTAQALRLAELLFPDVELGLAASDIGDEWLRTRSNSLHTSIEVEFYDRLLHEGRLSII